MKAPGLPWVSSGPGGPVVIPLCFQCRRYHFNARWESISCIPCSTGKYIKCRHLCDQSQWAAQWLESDLKRYVNPEGGMSMGIEGSRFCTNTLLPFPCRWCMWVTSRLEHPLRNSRLSLTQAHLTCGCPPSFAPTNSVVSTDTPYPYHLSIALPPCFALLVPDAAYLLCL